MHRNGRMVMSLTAAAKIEPTGWRRTFDGCLSVGTRKRLHLSLARDDIRRARAFFNQAATDVQLNQDQIDYVIDCAHDARRDARRHIEAAVRS